MTQVNPEAASQIPFLLSQAFRRMQQDLADLVDSTGFPDLRGSHLRILSMVPAEGARPSALAELAQMTRPALGELVAHLKDKGYLRVRADAADGRAVVITHTPKGRRAAAAAHRGMDDMERRWAQQIGRDRLDALIDALAQLAWRDPV